VPARPRERLRTLAPQLSAAVPVSVLFLGGLTVTLTAAQSLGLSASQTSSWIMALFGVPGALSVILSFRYRQPLMVTGNITALIFFASLGADVSFPELVGASIVAAALVLVAGAAGFTGRITSWIPAPIVMGLIAGAVLPFVWQVFTAMGTAPAVVGSVLAAYVVSQRMLGTKVPPIFPALVAGVIAAGVTGHFGDAPPGLALPDAIRVVPSFSVGAIATTAPVIAVLMTLQSNVPSVIYLRGQGYDPPERIINVASGGGTLVGSLFGPMAASLAVVLVPLVGGPGAGRRDHRYRAVFASCIMVGLIAAGAKTATDLAMFVPSELIVSLAGLALIPVLTNALGDTVRGPLRLGPVVAFATALSDVSLLGLGPFFWSLALGTGISLVLERDGWTQIRDD